MIEEAKTYACGTMMVATKIGSPVVMCPNCDTIQPTEYNGTNEGGGYRTPTVQDRRFNLAWTQRIRSYYPRAA